MKILVGQHELKIDKKDKVNQNEYKVTKCEFEFDEAITNDLVKIALFTNSAGTYKQYIINNECDIPAEILEKQETTTLGVYAYKEENEELELRYSPEEIKFYVSNGSYKENAENTEPITPTDKEQMEQALQNGLNDINDKIDEVDEKLDGIDTAIEETNNLNLDVSDKVDGDVTVTLTKKDASTKSVVISDGTSLQFMWQGTSLGIKTEDMEEYTFVDLQGIPGKKGDTGEPFTIKKTYSSVAEMNADFNNMEYGDYVMIASSVEVEDNAKLYTRGESQWIFITDFSGAMGIRGPVGATPNIQIGSVTSGSAPSVTRTGTDENPVLNFVLQKGDKGDKGNTGNTGNGISSIEKTSTSGLADTYTITFTNGNTTTFDVTNGNGIDRIEKTATVGNIDTYTIYFTNGSATTYEVANGEVTREELEEEVDRLSMIYNLFPTTSDEDTEMTLDGTGEVKLKKIDLKGNTYQESTTGKNLFDNVYGQTGNVYTKRIDASNPLGSVDCYPINLSPNTQYTLKIDMNGYRQNSTWIAGVCFENGDVISLLQLGSMADITTTTFTTDSTGVVYVGQRYGFTYGETGRMDLFLQTAKIQLEKGSTATDWEKYSGGNPSPNPDYPQDVQVVSGDNTIKVEGKNLFDGVFRQGNRFTDGLSDTTRLFTTQNYPVKSGVSYTLSTTINTSTYKWAVNLSTSEYPILNITPSSQYYDSGWKTSNSFTFTPSQDGYLGIVVAKTNGSDALTPSDIASVNWQLEYGSTATPYEPYQSQTYPINIGNIELCKIGDYQDSIVKDNGKWYLNKQIGKVVLDGSESNWAIAPDTTNLFVNNGSTFNGKYLEQNAFSDYFTNIVNSGITGNYQANQILQDNQFSFRYGTKDRIYIKSSVANTVNDFTTWLGTHNTTVYYVLETPTITEITDTTLIEQLDNLEKAYSYDTQTNITQTNDDMPFILDVEAILSLKNIFNS